MTARSAPGLLAAWSEQGDRPRFDVVTGVSTGALSAPFAFLGRDYDTTLRRIYSESTASDIFQSRSILTVLAEDGIVDSAPLRHMIDGYVDATHGRAARRGLSRGAAAADPHHQSRPGPRGDLEPRCDRGKRPPEGARPHRQRPAGIRFDSGRSFRR